MKNISIFRLLGCVIGSSVMVFSLCVVTMDLYVFIVTTFLAIWAFIFFSYKYAKYGYIGLQASIVLIITLAQGNGPPLTFDSPLERLAGILIGIATSFLVGNILWRHDLLTMLAHQLRKLNRYARHNCVMVLASGNSASRLYDLANPFWLTRGSLDTLAHNGLNALKTQRLAQYRHQFEQLVLLQSMLTTINEMIDQVSARQLANRLALDLNQIETQVASLYQITLNIAVAKQHAIDTIEQALAQLLTACDTDTPPLEIENAVAYLGLLRQLAVSAF